METERIAVARARATLNWGVSPHSPWAQASVANRGQTLHNACVGEGDAHPTPERGSRAVLEPAENHREVPFGPFVLERRIAVGGSAEVFVARPKTGSSPAPRLVIKRLLPTALGEEEFESLEREADLHRRVKHPGVVHVFGAGMVREEPFLAMEYVDGVDAFRLMRFSQTEGRPFPPGLPIYIARRIALALAAVHGTTDSLGHPLNIVHRDVTPSNIYLSVAGEVKLGDFGIARFDEKPTSAPGNTSSYGLKGKLGYLAPEQVAGEPVDRRADLFSLAVTLGEMLIGERIFPGSGQLAILLAIRDGNIEPLRTHGHKLPRGLLPILEKALTPDPAYRFATGAELAQALAAFEQPSEVELQAMLAEWVSWARDSSRLAKSLQTRVRDSVQRMKAAQAVSREALPSFSGEEPSPDAHPASQVTRAAELEPAPYSSREAATRAEFQAAFQHPPSQRTGAEEPSQVRRVSGSLLSDVSFAKLVEMIATGDLGPDDQVALMGEGFRRIGDIHELERHLLPSTTAATGRMFEPGVPDFVCELGTLPMLAVLARMRQRRETGGLFVLRKGADRTQRKEIYLRGGRLLHVASSAREELLGEYLVRRGALSREDLDQALRLLKNFGGRLGDTLISLQLVDAHDLFRAIRDQGRDRVATMCSWTEGDVAFYRGTAPGHVEFKLDLDLASPIMAGSILLGQGEPAVLLPSLSTRILPGPRIEATLDRRERGTAPSSMQRLPELSRKSPTLEQALSALTQPDVDGARVIGRKEACAALIAAKTVGWIQF